jgi:RNA polymerase sigma factor (sigma-70 family)
MSQNLDLNLWTAFIQGDREAFNKLYEHSIDLLYSFGLKYTNDEDLVKDCIHDLFLDLYKYRKSLSMEVSVKFYLFASLKRKICSTLKKGSLIVASDSANLSFHICFSAEDTLINYEHQKELLSKLQKELNRLPERQKEVLFLRFNSELNYEEIAVLMNISEATCRTLVYRAVKQLRLKMENTVMCQFLLLFFYSPSITWTVSCN